MVAALVERGQQMVRSGHFASQQIEVNYSVLQEKMSQLKEQSKIRKQKLLDAYESQMVSIHYSNAIKLMCLNLFLII